MGACTGRYGFDGKERRKNCGSCHSVLDATLPTRGIMAYVSGWAGDRVGGPMNPLHYNRHRGRITPVNSASE